ncbi:MAG: hypothetical protein AAFX44_00650 [Pseudomonadota bacterium]
MAIWKNPHLVTALLVAPVLAILAYFAIDALVGEKAHPAVAGKSYELIARPNCRRPGGTCQLANADFELTFEVVRSSTTLAELRVATSHPLRQLAIAVADPTTARPRPVLFASETSTDTSWKGALPQPLPNGAKLQLAVLADNQSEFFAEFSPAFIAAR